jgi:signal transduction histidine kinase
MQTTLTQAEAVQSVRRLKFPPQIESDFQQYYYSLIRTSLRIGLFLMVGLAFGFLFVSLSGKFSAETALLAGGVGLVNVLLLVLSFRREFVAYWQHLVVGTICISTCLVSIGHGDYATLSAALYYVLVFFPILRLQVRWLVLQMLAVDVAVFIFRRDRPPILEELAYDLVGLALPLLFAYRNEHDRRRNFAEQFLLTQERRLGQQKLEQTEKMLHVLSQAIGSIAHDLGNPLTTVHVSAETLVYLIKEDALDKKTELEFLEMITTGTQMLNALRLSLMEQTRVLEGRPILVELQATDVHHLVEAGARYQQPKFSTGRQITLEGDGLPLHVDEMRFIAVFMNLIGNALKYSDGEVKVTWRTDEGRVLVAVLDHGQKGRGISQAQAEKLFVPFGRLDTHAQVEGTGLGLLSVRKIAEAHDGEAYIEGHHDGTPESPVFSTAQGSYPWMLQDGFCTAFVTVFPLRTASPS